MIKIIKRPLPIGVTISRDEDYRSGVIFQMLVEDCCGKCYICEDSVHTAPNIEHRISHHGSDALRLCWSNLFLACTHCNNTKLNRYDGIIDPTKVDPEKVIELSLDVDDNLRELVKVRKIDGGGEVDITVDLLNAVYNGINTDMKKYACQQLKNKISNELMWFRQKLDDYKASPSDAMKKTIEHRLFDDSIFAAFKRGMVRSDSQLCEVFSCGSNG